MGSQLKNLSPQDLRLQNFLRSLRYPTYPIYIFFLRLQSSCRCRLLSSPLPLYQGKTLGYPPAYSCCELTPDFLACLPSPLQSISDSENIPHGFYTSQAQYSQSSTYLIRTSRGASLRGPQFQQQSLQSGYL